MPDEILNESGMTELHIACYEGELEWVQNCVKAGLDVHARDVRGYTPLHWVVDMGLCNVEREEIVEFLIEEGAEVDAKDSQGESVLETARRVEANYLVPLLVQHGAR